MTKKLIYMNFPISFLEEAFEDIKNTINNIMHYAIYKHSRSLKIGTEKEKMKDASLFFSTTLGNTEDAILGAKKSISTKNLKTPNVSINMTILWDFYEADKNEFDIACFCAFCAIKSIIGNKEYAKTNKSLITARMFGFSTLEVSGFIPETFISKLKDKYCNRYHIDKVLLTLQTDWGLKLYSDHSRGFYLSFSKSLEDLAIICIEKKTKSKAKLLTEEKAKAKEAALKKLGL